MMEKKRYIARERNTRGIIGVFFGIVVFLTIFSPFYLLTIRYHIGYVLKEIFNWIGNVSLMLGGFLILISILNIFVGKQLKVKWVIIGVALLWIGGWCTGTFTNLFGFLVGNTQGSGTGYH